jgi:hypothetical protein
VTPNWPVDGDAACYAPTRRSAGTAADEWDFVLPVNRQVSVRVKTLSRGPTEPLYFFWRGYRDTEDTAEPPLVEKVNDEGEVWDVVRADSNKFTLEFDKSRLLANEIMFHDRHKPSLSMISETEDIDILSLKDERGKDVVRMRFHTAKWTGKAPARVTSEADLQKLHALLYRLQTAEQRSR